MWTRGPTNPENFRKDNTSRVGARRGLVVSPEVRSPRSRYEYKEGGQTSYLGSERDSGTRRKDVLGVRCRFDFKTPVDPDRVSGSRDFTDERMGTTTLVR